MPILSRLPHVLATAIALSMFGVAQASQTVTFADDSGVSPWVLAECDTMRHQLIDLDETIERLPEVRAMREAFAQSPLGRREEAASRAFYAENCTAEGLAGLSDRCVALMAEIDACAEAFEHSADFKRVQALPDVMAFEHLSQRYADFCPEAPPVLEQGCDLGCEEEDPCEDGDVGEDDEDAALPTTV